MAGKSKKLKIKKLQINLTNRWLYTLIVFFSLIVIGVFVYAQIPNPGHDITRIEQPSGCGANQFLKWTTAGWTCDAVIAQPSGCDANQFLKWTGSAWTCENVCLSDGTNCPSVEEGLWSIYNSNLYYADGNVGIFGSVNPTLTFGNSWSSTPWAGVKLHVADKFLDVGDWWSGGGAVGVRLFTNDAERMRIDTSGNVGIGTTTPGAKLDVAGDLHVDDNLEVDGIFSLGTPTEKTISYGGAITVTSSYHKIDNRADASMDNLDTIHGGVDGMILVLRADNEARAPILRDGRGNIELEDDQMFSMGTRTRKIYLFYDAEMEKWYEIARFGG
jgi:hypothetical protein